MFYSDHHPSPNNKKTQFTNAKTIDTVFCLIMNDLMCIFNSNKERASSKFTHSLTRASRSQY